MAGVVLVAALTVAVPAFGSAHSAAAPATTRPALICPSPPTTGDARILGSSKAATAKQAAAKPRRGPRHRRSRHRVAPCIPPCRWLTAEPAGPTGPTGATDCEPPHACPLAAGPQRICPPIWCVADPDDPTGPSGPTGATPPCPRSPCRLAISGTPGAATGVTGPPLICRPLPCPIPSGTPSGATTPMIVCPRPPICPLGNALRASVCVPPCVVAHTTGATAGDAVCPPVPICPPPRATAGATADPALHACPEVPAAVASNR